MFISINTIFVIKYGPVLATGIRDLKFLRAVHHLITKGNMFGIIGEKNGSFEEKAKGRQQAERDRDSKV